MSGRSHSHNGVPGAPGEDKVKIKIDAAGIKEVGVRSIRAEQAKQRASGQQAASQSTIGAGCKF
jgi:hypothetical protein